MFGMDRGVVTVTSMQTRPQKNAQSANSRPDNLQADYVQVAEHPHPVQVNWERFTSHLVVFENLLVRIKGVVYTLDKNVGSGAIWRESVFGMDRGVVRRQRNRGLQSVDYYNL